MLLQWTLKQLQTLLLCFLRHLVPFAQIKPATLLKVTLIHGCFSRFLNYTNGTESRNALIDA